jgi:hypothetical protein
LGIKDNRRAERSAHLSEPLEVVVDPIDDRDPIDANSLLRRHVVVAVP